VVKALGLLSGGLDSTLAVKVLEEQGISVTGISFVTPFFGAGNAKKAANALGIPLLIENITEEHLKMLLNPKHGYGSAMNPCIDCHMLMLKIAGKIMQEKGFDFLFTGEVLGERPMSQNKQSLGVVAKGSGYGEYILRPLSAKLLPETRPEIEGKVDRSKLLDLSGRQRKRQFELAEKYGICDFPTPASGCLLTDPGFAGRLKDLLKKSPEPSVRDLELLKIGRHIRLDENNKMIVGRDEADNRKLSVIDKKGFVMLAPKGVRGPYCLVPEGVIGELLDKAVKICASYCSTEEGAEVAFFAKNHPERQGLKAVHSKANRPEGFIGGGKHGV